MIIYKPADVLTKEQAAIPGVFHVEDDGSGQAMWLVPVEVQERASRACGHLEPGFMGQQALVTNFFSGKDEMHTRTVWSTEWKREES